MTTAHEEVVQVEYRIPITMEFVGMGATEADARAEAIAQHQETIRAMCSAYGYTGEVNTPANEEMYVFARGQIERYLSQVVMGERRKAALTAVQAAIGVGVVFE